MAGKEVAVPKNALTTGAKLPASFGEIINLEAWAQSVVYGVPYSDPNPDYIAMTLAMMTITAQTLEEVWSETGILGVQKMVPDQESAESPPFEITDLYVTKSDFEVGAQCFVIISGIYLDSGEQFKCTTGAREVQAKLIALLKFGVWPIRAKFKRGISKDKGGKYLLFLMPPD